MAGQADNSMDSGLDRVVRSGEVAVSWITLAPGPSCAAALSDMRRATCTQCARCIEHDTCAQCDTCTECVICKHHGTHIKQGTSEQYGTSTASYMYLACLMHPVCHLCLTSFHVHTHSMLPAHSMQYPLSRLRPLLLAIFPHRDQLGALHQLHALTMWQ